MSDLVQYFLSLLPKGDLAQESNLGVFLLANSININVPKRTLLTPCGVEFPVITDLACGLIPF